MSDGGARAKRLFDRSQFEAALPLLEKVALGEDGDSSLNREVAEYQLAIALYNTGDFGGATERFSALATWGAVKSRESLLWLNRLTLRGCVTPALLDAVIDDRDDVVTDRCWGDVGCRLYHVHQLTIARALWERGEASKARADFEALLEFPEVGPTARSCIETIDANQSSASPR